MLLLSLILLLILLLLSLIISWSNFFRIDVSGSYKFNFNEAVNATIRLGFTNLTDRKNIIDSYYIVDENDANKAKRINNLSLPFTPNLSFRVNF